MAPKSSSLIDVVEHWRGRAKEARLMAEMLDNPAAKAVFNEIALDYDDLAEAAEKRVALLDKDGGGDNHTD